MRYLEISFPEEYAERVSEVCGATDEWKWTKPRCRDGRCEVSVLAAAGQSQPLIDALQTVFTGSTNWRIVVLPVEAAMGPSSHEAPAQEKEQDKSAAAREEIYQDVSTGAQFDANFIILTILSAIVAAIGINADNVAVVIGAMVIAPLLGPLLAFSFGSALGDLDLMKTSARTAVGGLLVGFATAYALSLIIDVNMGSRELLDRTVIGLDSVALALASGAAAALSISAGMSGALVGVMVAVALLPPSVAVALLLGAGEFGLAGRAAVLLATNVVSVNIASQIVFVLKGIRPRTWLERRSAKRSRQINLVVWGGLLAAITLLIVIRLA